MKYTIFASFVVFALLIRGLIKRSDKIDEKTKKNYLEREELANTTRRKSLDNLEYIVVPDYLLIDSTSHNNEELTDYISRLSYLTSEPIVNFSKISNTDLKLTYGVANLSLLTSYDENYMKLLPLLNKIGRLFFELNDYSLATKYLEYAVSVNSDIRETFDILAKIYVANNDISRLEELIAKAQSLDSINKNIICRNLSKYSQSDD